MQAAMIPITHQIIFPYLILAFEKSDTGRKDREEFELTRLRNAETGEEVLYTLTPATLKELNRQQG